MPCVGSSLFVSSAGSRFPVACLSWSVSIGFPHACSSLQVVTGSDNVANFLKWFDGSVDLDVEDKLLLGQNDSLDTTRGTKLSIVQVIDFPFFANCGVSPFSTRMNIRVLSKADEAIESLAFHRVIALLRTDQRSWTKTCAYSFICTVQSRGKSLMGFWTCSKYPSNLSLILLCSALCIEAPESSAPSQETKT